MVAELILLHTKHRISCWSDCIEMARNEINPKPNQWFTWYVDVAPCFGAIVHLHSSLCVVTMLPKFPLLLISSILAYCKKTSKQIVHMFFMDWPICEENIVPMFYTWGWLAHSKRKRQKFEKEVLSWNFLLCLFGGPPCTMLCDVISYVVRRAALACKQCGALHGMMKINQVSCFVVPERSAQRKRVRR